VRELRATLLRASIWSDSKILSVVEFKDSVLTMDEVQSQSLPQEIIDPIVLDEVKANVERHYITLALKRAGGNKTKAAELLGLNSQQVVSSKMKKLGIE
jgi:DNA-binding NtrC family response regulator